MIVAVDGPGGAGKSTVCREVARRLGFQLVDTGAIYRSLAWLAAERGLAWESPEAMGALACGLDVRFVAEAAGQRVWLGERDVSEAIRTAAMGRAASIVSAHPPVRAALLELQRRLGRVADSVVEGRDIGTVVFPDAELKVFFTASIEARAERRRTELERRGEAVDLAALTREIAERDTRDANREVAPLRRADDAVLLDTSALDFEGACAALESLVRTRQRRHE